MSRATVPTHYGKRILLVAATLILVGCFAHPAIPVYLESTSERAAVLPPTPVDPIAGYAEDHLATMTLTEKIASLLMLHYPGTDAAALRIFIDTFGLGGLILMGDNVPASVEEMAAMTTGLSADPGLPVLLGIDQEGGSVSRLPSDVAPGADQLKSKPVQATSDAFTSRSMLLESVGVNVNFGIVADVTADPGSFIYDRALGTDPAAATERIAAAVTGEGGRVASTLKHFPGHGAAPGEALIDDDVHRLLMLRRTISGQTGPFPGCGADCQETLRRMIGEFGIVRLNLQLHSPEGANS